MTTSNQATRFLLILLMASSARAALAQEMKPELHVYMMDCIGLADDLLDGMRAEVDGIYSPAGVRIVWVEERPPDPAKPYDARAYILDELPPSLRNLMSISKGRAPMAITLGPRPTEPTADIYVSRNAVLGRASNRHALAKIHMVRALGRTLAHELAHRFLRSSHTETGILKPVLSERDLIDGDRSDLFFTAGQIRLLEATANGGAGGREHEP